MPGARLPRNCANAVGNAEVPDGYSKKFKGTVPLKPLLPPARLMEFVLNLCPRHPTVLQLPFGHGGEVIPGCGTLAPEMDHVHQRPPEPHHRQW